MPGTLTAVLGFDETDDRSRLEKAASWFGIGTAILGVPGLFFIAWTVFVTRQEARAERTAHLLERMNNRHILESWSIVLAVVKVEDEAACVDRVRRTIVVPTGNDPLLSPRFALTSPRGVSRAGGHADAFVREVGDPRQEDFETTSLNNIVAFTNFYEEVALLYNSRRIDRQLLERGFGAQIIKGLCHHWWYVQYRRRGLPAAVSPTRVRIDEETEGYAEWERMVRRILRRRPEHRRLLTSAPVRSLCLPPERNVTADDWRNCGHLSSSVGALLREKGIGALADHLRTANDPDIGDGEAGITICIPDWDEIQPQPLLWRRAARRFGAWLNRDGPTRRLGARLQRVERRWRAVGRFGAWLDRERSTGPIRRLGARLEQVDPQVRHFKAYREAGQLLARRRRSVGREGIPDLIKELDDARSSSTRPGPGRRPRRVGWPGEEFLY